MRNLHKLLIILISVVFITSGALAQTDVSPKLSDQTQVTPDKPYQSYQVTEFAEKAPLQNEFNENQLEQLEKAGISVDDLKTKEGMAKAEKALGMQYAVYPKQSSFSSKPIYGTDDQVTVVIGIEANVSTGSNDTPFGTYWHDNQNQFLFPASDLLIAGIGAGDITEIGWDVVSADPATMNGFNIELKHTTATSVSGFEDGFTNVYSGSHTASVGWNMFTFTTPFTWDGTSNLLVKVCFDNTAYTSNSSVYISNTADPMNGWAYNDNTAGCSDPYEGNLSNRPNTRITGEENLAAPPGYPFDEIPASGTFDVNIDGDLTWTFGNNTDTYDFWLGLAGDMQLLLEDEPVTGSNGMYAYTGLDFGAAYEWQIIAHNANGTTNGPVWGFVTECDVYTAPFLEEFSIWPPVCWDMTGGTYEWTHYTVGVECAEAGFWGQTSGNTDYMTTAAIDISDGNYGLEFYWSHSYSASYPDDALEVLVSDDDGVSWTQVWYKIGTELESNDGAGNTTPGSFVSSEIISMGAFASPIKVRFIAHSGFGPDLFVDDVHVFNVAYGTLEGTVTDLATSSPIDGAVITVGSMNATSGTDGTYSLPGLLVGDYDVYCDATGFNPTSAPATILEDVITPLDFSMTAPTMDIDPLAINVTIDPNGMLTENIDIANNGDGALAWSAQLELLTDGTDDIWDLQLTFDVDAATGGAGNAGAECDGDYFYTTRWASNLIHKYDLEGNLESEFSIPGVSGLRDLAYDGTYMYGGAASTTIYQMDFDGLALVSSISSPQQVRSIAFDDGADAFWVSNWDTDLTLVDYTGAAVNVIPAATHGLGGMYGSAYDIWTAGGPYLWVFDQGAGAGAPQMVHQADLNTLTMTGVTHDFAADVPASTGAICGGLFIEENILVPGIASIGGLLQGTPDYFFVSELAESEPPWVSIDPNSGTVDPGNTGMMDVNFDATDLIPGTVKTANIHFSSNPDVGMVTVPVTMTVGDQEFGYIEGNVMLDGSAPYNIGDVTEVLVEAGPYMTNPDASGDYMVEVYPGTYDVVATLYGYETTTVTGVVVGEGATVSDVDITMPILYGMIEGTVTDIDTGDPIEDATVTLVDTDPLIVTMTAADGTYEFIIEAGTYSVMVEHPDFTTQTADDVVVTAETTTTLDFELGFPGFVVDPLIIEETLAPGGTTEVMVNLSNSGVGDLDWNAMLLILTNDQKEQWDLQLAFDVTAASGAAGNAGAECDGDYFYTTRWASNLIHKYDLEGNLDSEFSIPGVAGLRDLAFDGTYMYGGAASTTIYEMDFVGLTLVSTIGSPQQVRSIAYDDGEDAFWCSNWDTDLTLVSKAGAAVNTIPAATHGLGGMYGSAYDNFTEGGPYLWVFDQGAGAGTPQIVHQAELTTFTMTGVTHDFAADVPAATGAIGGGLFTVPNIFPGTVSMGGLLQGTPDYLFVSELAPFSTWITISPTSGTLAGGANEDMTVFLDATELVIPGVYEAEIHFSTDPSVGEPIVEVTLTVEGLIPAINLMAGYDCTDIELSWEMPAGGDPDSWNIYKDGDLLANVDVMEYTDPMVDPEMEYTFTVTAVYGGDESMPTPETMITVPIPEDLEPLNLEGAANTPGNGYATLMWEVPEACLAPDSYSIYRLDEMIAEGVTELEYVDGPIPMGSYEWEVVAVYYFGESGTSNAVQLDIITGIEDYDASMFQIFPNPASELINVKSPVEITNLRILNNIGQLVMDEEVNSMEYQINVSQYEAGFYFIKLETSEGTILRKVTVK